MHDGVGRIVCTYEPVLHTSVLLLRVVLMQALNLSQRPPFSPVKTGEERHGETVDVEARVGYLQCWSGYPRVRDGIMLGLVDNPRR